MLVEVSCFCDQDYTRICQSSVFLVSFLTLSKKMPCSTLNVFRILYEKATDFEHSLNLKGFFLTIKAERIVYSVSWSHLLLRPELCSHFPVILTFLVSFLTLTKKMPYSTLNVIRILYEKAADRRNFRNLTHNKISNYFDIGGRVLVVQVNSNYEITTFTLQKRDRKKSASALLI